MLCPATRPIVPFLLEIVAESSMRISSRAGVLDLICNIGQSAWSYARGESPAVQREGGGLSNGCVDLGRRVAKAVSIGLTVFLSILDEPEQTASPQLKAHAAIAVGWCQKQVHVAIQALLLRASRTREPLVAAALATAISTLAVAARSNPKVDIKAMAVCEAAFQAATTPGSRCVTALAAARASDGAASDAVLECLLAAPRIVDAICAEVVGWPWWPGPVAHASGGICADCISVLRHQESLAPASLLNAIHASLPYLDSIHGDEPVRLLFDRVIPEWSRQPSRDEPLLAMEVAAHPQLLRAITAMGTHDSVWLLRTPMGELRGIGAWHHHLRDCGLPMDQDGMQRLASEAASLLPDN